MPKFNSSDFDYASLRELESKLNGGPQSAAPDSEPIAPADSAPLPPPPAPDPADVREPDSDDAAPDPVSTATADTNWAAVLQEIADAGEPSPAPRLVHPAEKAAAAPELPRHHRPEPLQPPADMSRTVQVQLPELPATQDSHEPTPAGQADQHIAADRPYSAPQPLPPLPAEPQAEARHDLSSAPVNHNRLTPPSPSSPPPAEPGSSEGKDFRPAPPPGQPKWGDFVQSEASAPVAPGQRTDPDTSGRPPVGELPRPDEPVQPWTQYDEPTSIQRIRPQMPPPRVHSDAAAQHRDPAASANRQAGFAPRPAGSPVQQPRQWNPSPQDASGPQFPPPHHQQGAGVGHPPYPQQQLQPFLQQQPVHDQRTGARPADAYPPPLAPATAPSEPPPPPQQSAGSLDPGESAAIESVQFGLRKQRHEGPQQGFRAVLHKMGFPVKKSQAELLYDQDIAAINKPIHHAKTIGVMTFKGGVGKTTLGMAIASTVSQHRRKGEVAIVDADHKGSLARRAPGTQTHDLQRLAYDPEIYDVNDVKAYMLSNAQRLSILGSSTSPVAEPLRSDEYQRALAIVQANHSFVFVDMDTSAASPAYRDIVESLDAVIVPVATALDSAEASRDVMDWLRSHGYQELAGRVIVLLNYTSPKDPHLDTRAIALHYRNSEHCPVIEIPYDEHLAEAGPINLDLLHKHTRRMLIAAAAEVVTTLPTT
ncbi:AAA family ATPase [Mycolicibacterium sp.]|uniref:AAA family ATPase n=1 Tax=Mycolicibacterium sp. TaxID=2320850 RepID=UPI0037C75B19